MEMYVVLEYEPKDPADYAGRFMGIYSTRTKAEEAKQALKANYPEYFYEVGFTIVDHDPIVDGGSTPLTFDRWRK